MGINPRSLAARRAYATGFEDATSRHRGAGVVPAIIGWHPQLLPKHEDRGEDPMPDSAYKVMELVGASTTSWEDAAKNAVETAAKSLRDLRVAEVVDLDMALRQRQRDLRGDAQAHEGDGVENAPVFLVVLCGRAGWKR
jgi:flavin-binding protein dodecin